ARQHGARVGVRRVERVACRFVHLASGASSTRAPRSARRAHACRRVATRAPRIAWQAQSRPVTYAAMEFRELARINGGYAEARILHSAVTLGLFDQLDPAGRSADAIAVAAGTDARATNLLLNALVAMRLVRKDGDLFKETEV